MAFSFDPVKFVRSATELSNAFPADQDEITTNENLLDSINDQEPIDSNRTVISRPRSAPLTGEEAHSFYVSLISSDQNRNIDIDSSSDEESNDRVQETDAISELISTRPSTSNKDDQNSEIKSRKFCRVTKKAKFVRKIVPFEILRNRFLKAASDGDLSELTRCLGEQPSVLNSVDEFGWTALMCASYDGHDSVVEFLLRRGSDYNLKNRQNRTAMNIARRRGHRRIVELLTAAENGDFLHESSYRLSAEQGSKDMKQSYCEICSVNFCDPTHETSTVHLLNLAKMTEGDRPVDQGPSFSIWRSNKGYQLMLKEGWDLRTGGLGRHGQGRWYPVKTILKRDRRGLGAANAPKPRVTHFGPHDARAIEKNEEANRKIRLKSEKMSKKEQLRKKETETEWIRNFRRDFY